MPKSFAARFSQMSFASGVLSPRLHARPDLQRYFSGLKTLYNLLPTAQGTIVRRPGTEFIEDALTNGTPTYLIPFVYNNETAYVLECTGGSSATARFYQDGALMVGTEITLPYSVADMAEVKWCQSADILYLFHPEYTIRQVRRTSSTTFSIQTFTPFTGPFLEANTTAITLTPSATSGSVTITASSDLFASTDVGRLIRLNNGADTWGLFEITAYSSATSVTADTKVGPNDTSATTNWRLGAWSDTTGYPSVGTFHDDRLWVAGTTTQPYTVWSSEVGQYDRWRPSDTDGTVADDHGITASFVAGRVHHILWLESTPNGLVVGTSDSEGVLRPASIADPISPLNLERVIMTYRGSRAGAMPVRVDKSIIFVQRDGKTVREIYVSPDSQDFDTTDISILAEHLFTQKVKQLAYQQTPYSVVWGLLDDGTLVSLTFEKSQDVFGWAQHETDGLVESICVIPGPEQDELWMVVRRTINHSATRYVERLGTHWDNEIEDAKFFDCYVTVEQTASTTVSGLDHLEGETIGLLVDGAAHATRTVLSGDVTLSRKGTIIQAGLPIPNPVLETLPIESPRAYWGSSRKRIQHIHLNVMDSYGVIVNGEVALSRGGGTMSAPPNAYNGWVDVPVQPGTDENATIRLEIEGALPFHLRAIDAELMLGD